MLAKSQWIKQIVDPVSDEFNGAKSLQGFKYWLQSKEPNEVVGHYLHTEESPIICYLKDKYPGTEFLLKKDGIYFSKDRWKDCVLFSSHWGVELVEDFLQICHDEATEDLTAEFCLEILIEVLR